MRVLVTGGAGFIGSNLCDALVARGDDVRVLDNFSSGRRENLARLAGKIDLHEGDLRDRSACARAVEGVALILHEGAVPSVVRSVEDPVTTNDANVMGTMNILDAARRAGVERLVFAASSAAYGETEVLPKVETMTPDPVSPYAVSKLAGEHYLRVFAKLYGMKTVSLRYFNVFGPRQDPKSDYAAVVPRFITSILGGRPPTIYGDGEQSRDFCYIANVVQANLLAASADVHGEVVNIACAERTTLNQLVQIINEECGAALVATHEPPRAGDVRHSLADIGAANRLIGYKPTHMLREGLREAIQHYRKLSA